MGAEKEKLSLKWVERLHAGLTEIAGVACGYCEAVFQNVRINKKRHPSRGTSISSVLSVRSSGWNQPLTGQERSSFTNPLLRGLSFLLRRYSPRSRRSIWNSWPGRMSSSRRISAGRMICPLVETVVLMAGKIRSYLSMSIVRLH